MTFLYLRLPYIIVALAFIVLSMLSYVFRSRKYIIISLIILLSVFVIMASLRGSYVGIDTIEYERMYENFSKSNNIVADIWKKKPEILFYSMMAIFSKIFPYSTLVFRFFFYIAISLFLFFSFYKQDNCLTKISVFFFLGFWNMAFSGIRQAFAISVLTFAFSFLLFSPKKTKTKLIIYYSLNLLAIGFHTYSIICLVCPLLFRIKLTRKNFIYLFPLLVFVPDIFSGLLIFISNFFYIHYEVTTSRLSYTSIIIIILVISYYLLINQPFIKDTTKSKINNVFEIKFDDNTSYILWQVFLGMVFMVCNIFSTIVPRFAMFFYFSLSFFVCLFIESFKSKINQVIMNGIVLALFGLFFIIKLGELGLLPYALYY